MEQFGEHPPPVADPHIQQTLALLWRKADPAFLALQLAKYAHREPSLAALARELAATLAGEDQSRVLARLAPPAAAEPPAEAVHWDERYLAQARGEFPPEVPLLTVRIDPELGRLALALDRAAEFRLWALLRHHFGDPGWTTRAALYEAVAKAGACQSKRHYNRLLEQGAGLFWRLSASGRVYLRSYVRVTEALTRLALHQSPDLVATNLPGVPDVYLRVDGPLGQFKARVYAGWLESRWGPMIARRTLSVLFGCSEDTLRHWEQRLGPGIRVIPNYAQSAIDPKQDDQIIDYLPEHAYSYVTRRYQTRLRWRLSNRYRPRFIQEHPHKGQARKARTRAARIAWNPPVESCAVDKLPFDRSHRVPRRYFDDAKGLREHLKRLARQGKTGISPQTPRYVFRGEDRNAHGIYELSLDGETATNAHERMSIRREFVWWSGERRLHAAWLATRAG